MATGTGTASLNNIYDHNERGSNMQVTNVANVSLQGS